MTMNRNRREFT